MLNVLGRMMDDKIVESCQSCLTTLKDMVEADVAAGKIAPQT